MPKAQCVFHPTIPLLTVVTSQQLIFTCDIEALYSGQRIKNTWVQTTFATAAPSVLTSPAANPPSSAELATPFIVRMAARQTNCSNDPIKDTSGSGVAAASSYGASQPATRPYLGPYREFDQLEASADLPASTPLPTPISTPADYGFVSHISVINEYSATPMLLLATSKDRMVRIIANYQQPHSSVVVGFVAHDTKQQLNVTRARHENGFWHTASGETPLVTRASSHQNHPKSLRLLQHHHDAQRGGPTGQQQPLNSFSTGLLPSFFVGNIDLPHSLFMALKGVDMCTSPLVDAHSIIPSQQGIQYLRSGDKSLLDETCAAAIYQLCDAASSNHMLAARSTVLGNWEYSH